MAKYFPKINQYIASNHMQSRLSCRFIKSDSQYQARELQNETGKPVGRNRKARFVPQSFGTNPTCWIAPTGLSDSFQRALERNRLAGWPDPASQICSRGLWHETGKPAGQNWQAGFVPESSRTNPTCPFGKLNIALYLKSFHIFSFSLQKPSFSTILSSNGFTKIIIIMPNVFG